MLRDRVVRDRVMRAFMRADDDFFFSGVLDVYLSGCMLFNLLIYINKTLSSKVT